MDIILNGATAQLPDGISLAELVQRLDLAGKRIALEVNESIVPRSQLEQHRLRPGDRVEIVHAIGGG